MAPKTDTTSSTVEAAKSVKKDEPKKDSEDELFEEEDDFEEFQMGKIDPEAAKRALDDQFLDAGWDDEDKYDNFQERLKAEIAKVGKVTMSSLELYEDSRWYPVTLVDADIDQKTGKPTSITIKRVLNSQNNYNGNTGPGAGNSVSQAAQQSQSKTSNNQTQQTAAAAATLEVIPLSKSTNSNSSNSMTTLIRPSPQYDPEQFWPQANEIVEIQVLDSSDRVCWERARVRMSRGEFYYVGYVDINDNRPDWISEKTMLRPCQTDSDSESGNVDQQDQESEDQMVQNVLKSILQCQSQTSNTLNNDFSGVKLERAQLPQHTFTNTLTVDTSNDTVTTDSDGLLDYSDSNNKSIHLALWLETDDGQLCLQQIKEKAQLVLCGVKREMDEKVVVEKVGNNKKKNSKTRGNRGGRGKNKNANSESEVQEISISVSDEKNVKSASYLSTEATLTNTGTDKDLEETMPNENGSPPPDDHTITTTTIKTTISLILIGTSQAVRRGKMLLDIHLKHQRAILKFHTVRDQRIKYLEEQKSKYSESYKEDFVVEKDLIGLVVGKNGENIRRVQRQFDVEVILSESGKNSNSESQDNNESQTQSQTSTVRDRVRIYGKTELSVQLARSELEYVRCMYQIPTGYVGALVGRKRENLKEVEKSSGVVRIVFHNSMNNSNNSNNSTSNSTKSQDSLEIVGLKAAVEDAQMAFDSHCEYRSIYSEMNAEFERIDEGWIELEQDTGGVTSVTGKNNSKGGGPGKGGGKGGKDSNNQGRNSKGSSGSNKSRGKNINSNTSGKGGGSNTSGKNNQQGSNTSGKSRNNGSNTSGKNNSTKGTKFNSNSNSNTSGKNSNKNQNINKTKELSESDAVNNNNPTTGPTGSGPKKNNRSKGSKNNNNNKGNINTGPGTSKIDSDSNNVSKVNQTQDQNLSQRLEDSNSNSNKENVNNNNDNKSDGGESVPKKARKSDFRDGSSSMDHTPETWIPPVKA